MTIKELLFGAMAKFARENTGWLGVPASREIDARMKLIHRYIRPHELDEEDGIERKPHVTLAFGLGDRLTQEQRKKLSEMSRQAKIRIRSMDVFDQKNRKVLVFEVDSPDLRRMNKWVRDEVGLPGETFPEYRPHMTVAYLKKGVDEKKYKPLERLLKDKEFSVSEIEEAFEDGRQKIRAGA